MIGWYIIILAIYCSELAIFLQQNLTKITEQDPNNTGGHAESIPNRPGHLLQYQNTSYKLFKHDRIEGFCCPSHAHSSLGTQVGTAWAKYQTFVTKEMQTSKAWGVGVGMLKGSVTQDNCSGAT